MDKEIKLREEINPVLREADEIIISNADQYQYAGDCLKRNKSAQEMVDDELFEPLRESKRGVDKLWKKFKSGLLDPLLAAEKTIKTKMLTFQRQEEEKRQKEQARAKKERERLLKQAEKLKTDELKEQRLAEAEMVEAPVITIQSETPKIQGQAIKKTWKARITNKILFIQKAVETKNDTMLAFVELNQQKLDGFARATKGEIKFDGVEFYQERSLSSGGK